MVFQKLFETARSFVVRFEHLAEAKVLMKAIHQSKTKIAAKAGMSSQSNPLTRKNSRPQKPTRLIHFFAGVTTNPLSARAEKNLAVVTLALERSQQRSKKDIHGPAFNRKRRKAEKSEHGHLKQF